MDVQRSNIFSSVCNSTDKFYISLKMTENFQIQISVFSSISNAADIRKGTRVTEFGTDPNFLNHLSCTHLLWVNQDLDTFKMKTLKGCVFQPPITCVKFLITNYIVLHLSQIQLCRFQNYVYKLIPTTLNCSFLQVWILTCIIEKLT